MPRGGLPEKVLPQTLYREYWEKPVSHWSLEGSRSFTKAQKILNEFMNINISSINETTSPRSSSSPFISDGNVDNPLQSIDIFLQD
ncbi:uncharacterized protein OCT59_010138 [Rhizophagus irregularis]|uniref:uncharacterized protein n=1 Tax=Rhizophagus irregularis TaxID=588596 RepID=UPI00332CACD6|nr:hypothetical protein OCT59_010138 [Rhizophagus irregularis]